MRTSSILVVGVSWLGWGATPAAEPAPRPVATWAAGPMEVRVAFDRPVDPSVAAGVVGGAVSFGKDPGPGDPPAQGRPGGDRGSLRVASARLAEGGRTLVLVTDPHPREATYRLALPGVKGPGQAGAGSRVGLSYDLSGVEVSWAEGDRPAWSGWWPTVDPEGSRALLAGSAEHDRLWAMADRPGKLALRTLVALPRGKTSLLIRAGSPFEASLGSETRGSAPGDNGSHRASLGAESEGEAIELNLTLQTGGGGPPRLEATTSVDRAAPPSTLARSAFVLPWAPPALPAPAPPSAPEAVLAGGDPARGEALFYGEQAKCASCHQVRGKGVVGPDLTGLAGRDRAWVYQNIVEPSASIHPDYLSWTVVMKDGRIAMGVVRAEGADALKVGDIDARQTVIPRVDVEEIRPSSSSVMPVGLLGALGEEGTRDLLAYLTSPGPPR